MGEQDVQGEISRRRTGLSDNLHVLHALVETIELNNLYKLAKGEALFFFDLSEKLFLKFAIVCHIGGLLSFNYKAIIRIFSEKSSDNAQTNNMVFVKYAQIAL